MVERTITPRTTRDDLLVPHSPTEFLLHDISTQDWSTFVNYVVAELDHRSHENNAKGKEAMSREEFRDCQGGLKLLLQNGTSAFSTHAGSGSPSGSATHGPYELKAQALLRYRTVQSVPPPFHGGAPLQCSRHNGAHAYESFSNAYAPQDTSIPPWIPPSAFHAGRTSTLHPAIASSITRVPPGTIPKPMERQRTPQRSSWPPWLCRTAP